MNASTTRPGTTVARGYALIALLVAAALSSPMARAQAAPQTILFYGNSFTNGSGGVPFIVRGIAAAAGRPTPNVENAAVDGQTLGYHRTSNTAVIANPLDFAEPAGFKWDAVVMQGYSTESTHIGDVAKFRADAVGLYNNVKAHSPAVRPVLFETWARSPGHSFYPATFPNAAAMQAEVRTAYAQARGDVAAAVPPGTPARVAPVGDAFENAGWSNLYASDLYHANNRGSLLAALVLYSTLYQDDTADIDLAPVLQSLGLPASAGPELAAVADATTSVPEPTALALLALSPLLRRRRR